MHFRRPGIRAPKVRIHAIAGQRPAQRVCKKDKTFERDDTPRRLLSGPPYFRIASSISFTSWRTVSMSGSAKGVSSVELEKTEHVELAMIAFDKPTKKTIEWITTG
jgi:hypothetical protein